MFLSSLVNFLSTVKHAILLVLCCVLFACGGESDEDSDADGTNPQPTLEPSPSVEPTPTSEPTSTPEPTPTATTTPTPTVQPPEPEDSDSDGVADEYDLCPDTPAWRDVDDDGCPAYEIVGDCIPTEEEEQMIILHNEARAESRYCGTNSNDFREAVGPLRWDCQLAEAARLHSEDMTDNNFFSHTGSDGSSPFERMQDAGYQYRTAGENIIAGYRSVASAVEGWLDSPGHCKNIMGAGFQDMGAGKSENSNTTYGVYWTAGFGARR